MDPKGQLPLRSALTAVLLGCFWSGMVWTSFAVARSDRVEPAADPGDAAVVHSRAEASGGCLTRPPSFWATQPELTTTSLDPPLEVCGATLDTVEVGWPTSVVEALCVGGRDREILGAEFSQLVRQCTAATLNVTASSRLGGRCGSPREHPYIDAFLENCCGADSVCTGQTKYTDAGEPWTVEQCIAGLDRFNHAYPDSLNFPSPAGPDAPGRCRAAMNNGMVVRPTP